MLWRAVLRGVEPFLIGQVGFLSAEGYELRTDAQVELRLVVDGEERLVDGKDLLKYLASSAQLDIPERQGPSHFTIQEGRWEVSTTLDGDGGIVLPRPARQLVAWDLRGALAQGFLANVPLPEDRSHFETLKLYREILPDLIQWGAGQGPKGRADRLSALLRKIKSKSGARLLETLAGEATLVQSTKKFWSKVLPGLPMQFLRVEGQDVQPWKRTGRATPAGQLAEEVLTNLSDETVEHHYVGGQRVPVTRLPVPRQDDQDAGRGHGAQRDLADPATVGGLEAETESDVKERLLDAAHCRLTRKQCEAFVAELDFRMAKRAGSPVQRDARANQTHRKHLSDAYRRCHVANFEELVRWLLNQ